MYINLKTAILFSDTLQFICQTTASHGTTMLLLYSTIHKAAGLTVPGRSMILPGTVPETPISREWSQWLEQRLGVIPTAGRTPTGGFVNSAVNGQHAFSDNLW